jgi:hypothetical protein
LVLAFKENQPTRLTAQRPPDAKHLLRVDFKSPFTIKRHAGLKVTKFGKMPRRVGKQFQRCSQSPGNELAIRIGEIRPVVRHEAEAAAGHGQGEG